MTELNREMVELRNLGYSYREISERTGVPSATVWRRITKFAGNNMSEMKKPKRKPGRMTCTRAPEYKPSSPAEGSPVRQETDKEKIARLERELREARMRADLYNEIINVAEKKFDIQIRKKAGTKQ